MSDEDLLRKALAEIGRRGGHARAKALTAKERKAIATKASKAAAVVRTKKSKARIETAKKGRGSSHVRSNPTRVPSKSLPSRARQTLRQHLTPVPDVPRSSRPGLGRFAV